MEDVQVDAMGTASKPQSISEMIDKRDGVTSKPLIRGPRVVDKREVELQGIIAQAWCSEENSHKEMDVALASEIARLVYVDEEMQLDLAEDQANLGCATTKEILCELTLRCQDGTINDDD